VLALLVPPPMAEVLDVVEAILPICRSAQKPVLITVMGDARAAEAVSRLNRESIPSYAFPEQAASALAALVEYQERHQGADGEVLRVETAVDAAKKRALRQEVQKWRGTNLPQSLAAEMAQEYGVPVLQPVQVSSAQGAAQTAELLGFPVALKIASTDILHKSDVAGVLLGLGSGVEVAQGYEQLMRQVRGAAPDANIAGAVVQRMAPEGQDVIVGIARDRQFGPYLMFGSGGVEVEGLGDIAFVLPPLTRLEVERWMDSTWAGRRLRGYRGLSGGDREACLDIFLRLCELSMDFPELRELEINPLRVLRCGRGALAIDVRAWVSASA
jgi:acyl-CoA synthetase (NDP forming)